MTTAARFELEAALRASMLGSQGGGRAAREFIDEEDSSCGGLLNLEIGAGARGIFDLVGPVLVGAATDRQSVCSEKAKPRGRQSEGTQLRLEIMLGFTVAF